MHTPRKLTVIEACLLCRTTRRLVEPFVTNSTFSAGTLNVSISKYFPLYTIFAQRNQGNTPYLVQDLANNIKKANLDRQTINEETENTIRYFANNPTEVPNSPAFVIITDYQFCKYLILEGNKRLSGFALSNIEINTKFETYFVQTTFQWEEILNFFNMVSHC